MLPEYQLVPRKPEDPCCKAPLVDHPHESKRISLETVSDILSAIQPQDNLREFHFLVVNLRIV
ncbi:hypothetical protein SCA6_002773 [Theobroma cacao]